MSKERASILGKYTEKEKQKRRTREKINDLVNKGLAELADKKEARKKPQKDLEKQKKTIDDLEAGWDLDEEDPENILDAKIEGYQKEDDDRKRKLKEEIEFDTSDTESDSAENSDDPFGTVNADESSFEELSSVEYSGEIKDNNKKRKKSKKKKKEKASVEVSPDYAEEVEWYGFEPNEKDFFKRGEFMEEQNLTKARMELEKEPWEAIQNMEPQEIIDTAENIKYRTDSATMELIDNITGKKGAGEEYAIENNRLILLDSDIDYIEKELMTKFDFNVNRAGWLKKFNIKRKLDPENFENFKYLVSTHKKMQKEYKKQIKKHLKKFADTVDLVTPRVAKTKSSIVRMP